MNKLFSKIAVFAVGAAMAIGVGVAASRSFAEAKAVDHDVLVADFTAKTNGHSAYYDSWDYDENFTLNAGANNNGGWAFVKFGIKYDSKNPTQYPGTSAAYVKTKSAISNAISKVEIKVIDNTESSITTSNSSVTMSLDVSADADFTSPTNIDKGSITFKTANTITITPTSGDAWDTNSYFRLNINTTTSGSKNGIIWIESIKFIEDIPEQDLDHIELADAAIYSGKQFQTTVVPKPDGALLPDDLTYVSGDTSIFTVSNTGLITASAENHGTTTLTVTSTSNPTITVTADVTVNVCPTNISVGSKYILVAQYEDESVSPAVVKKVELTGINTAGTNPYGSIAEYDSEPAGTYDLTVVAGVAEGTVGLQHGDEYLAFSGTANALKSKNTLDAESSWVVETDTDDDSITTYASFGTDAPRRLRFNPNKSTNPISYSPRFACYTSAQTALKLVSSAPSISVAQDKLEIAKAETATLTTTLLNGATGIPTYVADPAAAVTLTPSADGLTCTVTANSVAATTDVTITVSLAGCADKQVTVTVKRDAVLTGIEIITNPTKVEYYQNATSVDLTGIVVHKNYDSGDPEVAELSELEVKSFDFSAIVTSTDVTIGLKDTEFTDTFSVAVVEKPAVAEKTVAEALAAGGALTPVAGETVKGDEMKVTGYVTRINNWTSHYGNADIYIADTVGGTTTLQVYQLADQTAYEQLALGTQIKVTGTIAVYKKDADTAAKVELVEVSEIELLTTPSFTEMTVAEALTAGGALTPVAGQTVYDTKSVKVSGFLTSKGTWSGSYYNGDLYIADEKGGTPTLQILRFGIESVFNDLLVGAELEIKGILAIYKKNAQTDAVVELTSPVVTVKGGGEVIELNVANALARGNALTEPADKSSTFDTATVRITGYVVKQGEWSTQYNNADFWIADSVSDNDWLDIFRYGNKDIFDQCKPGAQVQVTGILALYKNGTKLTVELTGATVVVLTPAPELDPIETNVAGAIEACAGITPVAGQTVMLSNIQEYAVTGYVISSNWSTQYNNGSIWIVDSADAQKGAPEVQAYRFGDKDIFDQCIKGAKITITGLLGVYLKDAQSSPDYELTNCSISDIVLPAVVPTSLDYEGELEKTEYEIGEDFDTTLAGITKFVVTYSDSTTEAPHTEDKTLADVTVDASAFDKTTAGDYMIKVSYTEEETTVFFNLSVTVKPEEPGPGPEPQPVTLVDITVANSKSNYQVGDILDLDAITVIMVYSDESTREGVRSTDYGFTFPEGFDGTFTEAGEITITVYAKADETIKHDVVLTVSEAPVVLTRITVETTVTEYTVGDQIDPNSITITAHYSDGSSEVVTTGFIVTFDSSEAGDNVEVTVSYTEDGVTKSASFYVTVKAAPSGKKGCGGDIAATSIILSTLSLAGVALLALKKRKED